ncbi:MULTISPECIES: glycosyltransferase family 4 protein [Brevibacillus]|jgi:spore coat protein SA|uniref:Lipopolysaccharide N-acetylglucosaminyltransferase n=1 Tax=Brevibacillus aydinogluensis TaxID=927786 RepID=A0AA48M9K0_9BACL|nr:MULTISPECIES: glycosyltransferase family 4 protein [Brevibacillus]REK62994.1 MAG: glycosyltransferase family 1 protein [Brevibacillus sp.]MBR8658246.1 glycosyltransferase family 4 protein [Brevibacillus sp. NL20B1]MDT3414720.1 spore coat protein SA [Brevibacillus aydinogluensis]NNV01418.1 glycosyltransferase family 1 protein [Brevibacillus sp. MCWH]CAJ1002106.1 Lipopolysaccharide N-acetylglucosaminyltransferase [Brevibacillus aydinogluensis]
MKGLLICTEKLPVPPIRGGAIQTYIAGIVNILGKHHNVTVLGTSDPSLPQEETRENVRYVRVNGQGVFELYAKEVVQYLRNNSYDIIHVFNRPRLVPLIREVCPRARIILSMHNDMFDPAKIEPDVAIKAIEETERIITISNYVGKVICELYPQAASKVRTIYSGVNLDVFVPWERSQTAKQIRNQLRSEYKLNGKQVILFVGRLTPKKGADVLVRAMNELSRRHSDIALVLVGGSWYSVDKVSDYVAYVRALAARSPVPVITTGYVPAEQIHHWFWAGDIFVCPSQWEEPLARVHYEAMAAGLPFVTTQRGGNPEVIINGNGLLVEQPENPQAFAEKLHTLLSNRDLQRRMGNAGRRLAEERFTWSRVAKEVLQVWNG